MPIDKGKPNTVQPGHICYTCAEFIGKTCKYGNHKKASCLEFTAENNGKCELFHIVDETITMNSDNKVQSRSNQMIKTADKMTDSELNVALYRKIKAATSETQNKLFNYWKYLFPEKYAKEMVTDTIETDAKGKQSYVNKKKKKKLFNK